MNTNAKFIKETMKKLGDMRSLCISEHRDPRSDERKTAQRMLKQIEDCEQTEEFFDKRKSGLSVNVPTSDELGGGRSTEGRSVGNLKSPGQSKEYRSLFPGGSRKEWTDNKMTFFEAVFSGRAHPELTKRAMTEGVPSDGGFLVPTEFSEKIHAVSLENELIMPRAFVQPMTSNELKLPAMEIGNHGTNLFGGFEASYKSEAATLTEKNPKVRQMTLQANKLTGFLRLSNELASDMGGGENQLISLCGKGLSWYRDKSFLKGSGAGEPQGILNASCLIAVAKQAGQAGDSIVYQNLTKMMSRMYAGSFANSVWICHQSTIPELLGLSIAVGTGGSYIPVMSESDGQFRILTRPVIFTEKTEPLGDQGDIVLADLSQYVVGLRKGMSFDTSQHVYFTTDELAARLIERHDGQALWNEALTLEDGSTTVSPFVTLAERT